MQLIGRHLSPFVRRVAVTLRHYGLDYEHVPLAVVGDDAARIREANPLGRVPALVLDDGEVLVESAVILDYLDREVGPERALTPASGPERTRVMLLAAFGTGAVEKAVSVVYEGRFRPEEKQHAPWVERCTDQARGGFVHLDGLLTGDWLCGGRMTQADVTAACAWQFTAIAAPQVKAAIEAPRLDALVERMLEIAPFRDTVPE